MSCCVICPQQKEYTRNGYEVIKFMHGFENALFSHWPDALVTLLTQDGKEQSSLRFNSRIVNDAALLRLPNEVHLLILEWLEVRDILALGLTCQIFWNYAIYAIHNTGSSGAWARRNWISVNSNKQITGSWAGKSIVCTDGNTQIVSMPRFQDGAILQPHCLNGHHVGGAIYGQYTFTVPNSAYCHLLLRRAYAEGWLRRTMKFKNVEETILGGPGRVLRNLTTKEFVREDALVSTIGLGHVVLMRICCFDHVFSEGKIPHHGAWAGHRFDIVEKKVMEEGEMRLWVDITIEIREEIAVCWSEKFGPEWQTIWALLEAPRGHEWMRIAAITDEISGI